MDKPKSPLITPERAERIRQRMAASGISEEELPWLLGKFGVSELTQLTEYQCELLEGFLRQRRNPGEPKEYVWARYTEQWNITNP
jgi:hypothetical protein